MIILVVLGFMLHSKINIKSYASALPELLSLAVLLINLHLSTVNLPLSEPQTPPPLPLFAEHFTTLHINTELVIFEIPIQPIAPPLPLDATLLLNLELLTIKLGPPKDIEEFDKNKAIVIKFDQELKFVPELGDYKKFSC